MEIFLRFKCALWVNATLVLPNCIILYGFVSSVGFTFNYTGSATFILIYRFNRFLGPSSSIYHPPPYLSVSFHTTSFSDNPPTFHLHFLRHSRRIRFFFALKHALIISIYSLCPSGHSSVFPFVAVTYSFYSSHSSTQPSTQSRLRHTRHFVLFARFITSNRT